LCGASLAEDLIDAPRWNAGSHLQSVQFDHEPEPKMRRVRLTTLPTPGELAPDWDVGGEVEPVIVSVVPGPAKAR
jgi:hypothetical protein